MAELTEPRSVALDATGGVYIADSKPAVIKQFGPGGGFIRSFGREGGGPGEFRIAFLATAPRVLVVHDAESSRTSVFDTTGAFLRS
jgi:DNA-binding beta-propeller fold protein YncE